jgi:ornithine racemase
VRRVPELRVDIDAIGRNTEVVASLLRKLSLDLVAVTKGCLGEPRVAAAMLAAGAVALADTRDENLRRLRAAFPRAELHRIHLPSLVEPFEPGDVTYVTSGEGAVAVAALSSPAAPRSPAAPSSAPSPRRVMIQVETGDEREGVPEALLLDLADRVAAEPRLRLEGVSTNYACFLGAPEGIRGSLEGVALAARSLRSAGFPVTRVSGGNSSVLWLLTRGERLPEEITELRCGEALLLGQDALRYERLPGCAADACVLSAEVLEGYTRPTSGGGVSPEQGAEGQTSPERAHRLVLGIGRQDLSGGAVKFAEPGLHEVGRSADYLVVEVTPGSHAPAVGARVEMVPAYEALVAAWTSPYVEVRFRGA